MLPLAVPRRFIPRVRAASDLVVEVDLRTGRVALTGDLDRHTAHRLVDAFRALAATPQRQWVLEVDRLYRCDVDGLAAIGACYRRAARHGAEFGVVGASARLREAMTTLGRTAFG